jgi:hypothetical protein
MEFKMIGILFPNQLSMNHILFFRIPAWERAGRFHSMILKAGWAIAISLSGFFLPPEKAGAQAKKDAPVYTCRMPLYDHNYTCELPVKKNIECRKSAPDSTEMMDQDIKKIKAKIHPKCSKSASVITKEEPMAQVPMTLIKCGLSAEHVVIPDTLELNTDVKEGVYDEVLPEPVYSCILVDPFPEELPDILPPVIDGEFEEMNAPALKGEEEAEISSPLMDLNLTKIEVFPNPCSNGIANLKYKLVNVGMASIDLYDMNGNLVKNLLPAKLMEPSVYEMQYDVSDLKNGIYFCQLVAGSEKITTRIVISK